MSNIRTFSSSYPTDGADDEGEDNLDPAEVSRLYQESILSHFESHVADASKDVFSSLD